MGSPPFCLLIGGIRTDFQKTLEFADRAGDGLKIGLKDPLVVIGTLCVSIQVA